MPNRNDERENGEDLVITPGGLKRRDHVHPVRPGEAVRRNPDGTFSVVPADPPIESPPEKKQGDENG
jgi:hypothetical protein